MRIHYLQHVPFEDAANIATWAIDRGHAVSHTRLDLDEPLPAADAFDWLVVMGGPMNVDEHDIYPWLPREKQFIRQTIDRGTRVLGVCLGAQLAAEVLGGAVTKNRQKEIGWFPVTLTEAGTANSLLSGLPPQFTAFHWHGDTFSIPPGAIRIAGSAACDNQAFQFGRHVLGLQFHLDYSQASVEKMVQHCGQELVDMPGIQPAQQMLPCVERFRDIQQWLYRLLDAMV